MSNNLINYIIVNYNGEKYLQKLLNSIEQQTYKEFDVCIVDNNSSDNSLDIIKNHSLYQINKIKLYPLNKNTGFALGNNIGIKNTNGRYIALINNDVILQNDWAEQMIDLAEKSNKTGIITSKVLFAQKRNIINSAGVGIDETAMAYNRGMFEIDNNQYNNIEETEAFYGAAGFLKRNVIKDTGYFNKYYFMYQEEYDLSVRVKLSGWTILYNPKAVVYHFHSASAGRYSPKKTYYSIRNYVWNTYKYLSVFKLVSAHKNFFNKIIQSKNSVNEKVVLSRQQKTKLFFIIIVAYITGSIYGIANRITGKLLK